MGEAVCDGESRGTPVRGCLSSDGGKDPAGVWLGCRS